MSIHSPPSPHQRDPSRLTRQRFDALIIGGGINGAGIARDLALRGVRVALVEKEDFASGTSSASTKLVHGGLRYLERFDFRLVFESCRERRILQTIAPHLVRPLPFFIPVYKGDPRSLLTIRAGMTLYDLLALFRNTGRHTILSADETLRSEPALQGEGLVGAARYWDCRMDDARLCLENILAAAEAGAEVFNYMTLTSLLKRGGKVCGARLRDGIDGQEREVEATVIINATGPWLDRLCALDGDDAAKLRTTRGTHILVPRINCGDEALYLTAGRDDRLFFVIPWGELSLIGTTDVDDRRDPDNLTPTEDDIAYLLGEAKRHLRTPELKRDDIVSSFAGLRPLVAEEESKATRTSREHRLFTSASGLLSVGGGKYTTYRAVAEEVSSRVMELLGRPRGPSLTGSTPLPGGATGDFRRYLATQVPLWRSACDLPRERLEGLADLYGSRTPRLLAMADAEPDLLYPIVAGSPLLALQVAYAVDFEGARTPEDILRRRTPLALLPGRGLAELPAVAEIMASRLGIDRDRRQEWENSYRKRYLTPLKGSSMEIKLQHASPLAHKTPCLVLTALEGKPSTPLLKDLDVRLDGIVARAFKDGEFTGRLGETLLIHSGSRLAQERILLLGLGKEKGFGAERLRQAAGQLVGFLQGRRLGTCAIDLTSLPLRRMTLEAATQAIAEGLQLAGYRFDRHRTENGRELPPLLERATLLVSSKGDLRAATPGLKVARCIDRGVTLARDLVNEPGNVKSPDYLARQARALSEEVPLHCTVLDRAQLEVEGMGALLGVAQGSIREPRLIVLEHRGGNGDARPIVLIGKGVVFDAGGISLKPAEKMDEMKMDMAGGAAVMGTLLSAALLKLPINLIGIIPAVENLPSGSAIRPGDILTSLSGRTIEVLNTDAEGRLILADALTYARRFEPRVVIDLATLTGACIIALGHHASAILGNHNGLIRKLIQAGERSGERLWQLPLWEDYGHQIKSEVADIKNTGGRPAGTITAAAFLQKFAAEFTWAHLDIAGTAWEEKGRPCQPKGGTGVGVRLLLAYLMQGGFPGEAD